MNLFRRILVPHDFSPDATRALELANELARGHGGRIVVLHVVAPVPPPTAFPEQIGTWIPAVELVSGARRQLEAVVRKTVAGPRAPRVDCRVVLGDPYRSIVDAARGVDAIVMGTAGRSGLPHLLIGSVAEKVVRHAPVPVLTVRRRAARSRRSSRTGGRRTSAGGR
jgi:nucleotide-binding universal stress UspA family protein